MKEFDNLVYQYKNEQEFQESIDLALKEKDSAKKEKRRQMALKNTWEQRVVEINEILANQLGE